MWPDDFGDAFPKGSPLPNPGKQTPRALQRRTEQDLWRGRGWQSEQEAPTLGSTVRCQLEPGGAGAQARVALPVPARQGGRTRVQASRPRAPPGLTSAAAPKAGCRGSAQRWVWGPRRRREEGPRGAEGCSERPGRRRSSAQSSLQPAERRRSPLPGFERSRWRFPGARRPGVVLRLDPGGPAVGRLPQFHGWLGAQ